MKMRLTIITRLISSIPNRNDHKEGPRSDETEGTIRRPARRERRPQQGSQRSAGAAFRFQES
jgi:hypothetical protein